MGEVELPSDVHGTVWVPYDKHGKWRQRLAEEINTSGIKVEMSNVGPNGASRRVRTSR